MMKNAKSSTVVAAVFAVAGALFAACMQSPTEPDPSTTDGQFNNRSVACGNGVCEPGLGETALSCMLDCHVCGDGICAWGPENDTNCFQDCHCGNGICEPAAGEAIENCWTDCPFPCLSGPDASLSGGVASPRC